MDTLSNTTSTKCSEIQYSILGLYPGVASSLVSRGFLGTLPGDSSWKTEEGSFHSRHLEGLTSEARPVSGHWSVVSIRWLCSEPTCPEYSPVFTTHVANFIPSPGLPGTTILVLFATSSIFTCANKFSTTRSPCQFAWFVQYFVIYHILTSLGWILLFVSCWRCLCSWRYMCTITICPTLTTYRIQ